MKPFWKYFDFFSKFLFKNFYLFIYLMFVAACINYIIKLPNQYVPAIVILLAITSAVNLIKPKLYLSKNIVFMSIHTYFGLPLFLMFLFAFAINPNVYYVLTFSILITIVIFFVLFFYHRYKYLNSLKIDSNSPDIKSDFLNRSKVSFDIVRFIFLVILTLSAIYGKLLDDFGTFTNFFPTFKSFSIEQLRNSFQLTIQIIAIPFVFSSTLIRIIIDWLLIKKIKI